MIQEAHILIGMMITDGQDTLKENEKSYKLFYYISADSSTVRIGG